MSIPRWKAVDRTSGFCILASTTTAIVTCREPTCSLTHDRVETYDAFHNRTSQSHQNRHRHSTCRSLSQWLVGLGSNIEIAAPKAKRAQNRIPRTPWYLGWEALACWQAHHPPWSGPTGSSRKMKGLKFLVF